MADSVAALERLVTQYFVRNADRFGLDAGRVSAHHRFNLFGFTHRAFAVEDGRRRLHVKLTGDQPPDGLRAWVRVHRRLESDYRAPALLAVLENGILPDDTFGLVFAHVDGRPLDLDADGVAMPDVLEAVRRLHADHVLARDLANEAAGRTCADDLVDTYVQRLDEDLGSIEAGLDRLAFLPQGFAPWARAEVQRLERAARLDPAFGAQAAAVVHGDLHGGNVLVADAGPWHIIDWDDLHSGGDPALDVAVLLWPALRRHGHGPLVARYVSGGGDPGVEERMPLYRRAHLLDEVVDTLADFVEADGRGTEAELTALRAAKRALHADALALYRRDYANGS